MIALVFLGEVEKEEMKLFSAFCGCRLFFFWLGRKLRRCGGDVVLGKDRVEFLWNDVHGGFIFWSYYV